MAADTYTRERLHLVHRDEREAITMVGKDATSFQARAACGQHRGFGSESDEVQCVSNEWASEITCGRCKRIYEHWKRVNAPSSAVR